MLAPAVGLLVSGFTQPILLSPNFPAHTLSLALGRRWQAVGADHVVQFQELTRVYREQKLLVSVALGLVVLHLHVGIQQVLSSQVLGVSFLTGVHGRGEGRWRPLAALPQVDTLHGGHRTLHAMCGTRSRKVVGLCLLIFTRDEESLPS